VLTLALLPASAHAFDDASQFFDQKANPHAATFGASGEGVYFTGAPRYASLTCGSCHLGGPQKVGLRLNADDPNLFSDGYQPGKVYQLEVQLTDETAGTQYKGTTCTDPPAPDDTYAYVQCNNNGFALEIDDAVGPLKGYCAQAPVAGACPMPDFTRDESLVAPDNDAVFAARVYSSDPNMPKLVERNGALSWRFYWTAPKAGTGPLTVYAAAVDGNGGAGTATNDQDPDGDDTVAASFFLQESGAPVKRNASAGCAAAPGAPTFAWSLLLCVLLLVARRRRHSN
jgi:hypothetical protein